MAATGTLTVTTFFALAALVASLAACVTDLRTRRIPNALTFGTAAVALLAHAATGGWMGLLGGLGGLAIGLAAFLPFFLLGGMGAGDVKLLAALGALLGPFDVFWLAIYASLFGGVLALIVALSRGYLGTALRNIAAMLGYWCLVGPQPAASMTLAESSAPRLAYAVPIFCGTMATLWLR